MIWREKRLLLIVLAVLLLANAIFFLTYRVQYESRLEDLDHELEQVKAQLAEARRARITAQQQYAGYRNIQRDVEQVFDERWSTRDQRLTRMIAEVKRLAETAELVPPSTSYSLTENTSRNQLTTDSTEVGITFTVRGTYQQVRRLINMLELSEQFIIIDGISLSSSAGNELTLNLRIKTLFREPSAGAQGRSNRRL